MAVTPGHPLYGIPLVCEHHSKRKFYRFYGPTRCPPNYELAKKCPNIGQILLQGTGGRPVVEEGKVQTNAGSVKRCRQKKADIHESLLESFEQIAHEKTGLQVLCESNSQKLQALQDDRDALLRDNWALHAKVEELSKQNSDLFQQCFTLNKNFTDLQSVCDKQTQQISEKDEAILYLHHQLASGRN